MRFFHFQLGLTRKFLLFFVMTAILPIVVISGLFFQTVDQKLSERIAVHLRYGLHVAQELYEQDMRRLEVLSTEAAFLSINEKYQHYLSTGEYAPLDRLLNRYQQSKKLDIVTLINNQGKSIASTEEVTEDMEPASYYAMIRRALRGKTVNSTEAYHNKVTGKNELTYLVVSPVFSAYEAHKVIAVLLTGQYLDNKFSLGRLGKIIPNLESRVFIKDGNKIPELVFSSFPHGSDDDLFPSPLWADPPTKGHETTFEETVNDIGYRSRVSIINNYLGHPIAYLIVSNSKADLSELVHRDFLYIGLYLLMGLAVIALAGTWFKRTFVDPIVDLSDTSKLVAAGDLSVRVHQSPSQRELSDMVDNYNTMLAQLQESEQLRNNFISTLTHDLRTPLVAQKRALELFETHKAELSPKLASFAEGLLKSNDNLLEMVNKILDTYQYEAGRIQLNPEPVDLHQLTEDCFSALYPIASNKQVTPHQYGSPGFAVLVGGWASAAAGLE